MRLQNSVDRFFSELEVFEDKARGHNYKVYMHQAVSEFLKDETKENAFAVYTAFFDSYRIKLEGTTNRFVDLLDVLRGYEENAATLIDKQRDHYVHSVNVFILGLCIYAQNANYQAAFDAANMDKSDYPYSYDTRHEEFLYRWGIASLFHDVGYPIEIIGKQVDKFVGFITGVGEGARTGSHVEIDGIERLNSIAEVVPKREFTRTFYEKHASSVYVDPLKPLDLLAHKLHTSLGVDLKTAKIVLDDFINVMARGRFIDHGYYSAIIILKWYGYLIQACRYRPEYFFYPVLDSASAILLHNFYRNVIQKPPFSLGPLGCASHPIAWLLILCDELQEWNREAYGIADRRRTHAAEASIAAADNHLAVTYMARRGSLPDGFAPDKEALLHHVLDMDSVFVGGFSVSCETMDGVEPSSGAVPTAEEVIPRPLLENLERLAVAIHDMYNHKQSERYPDKPLQYPRFTDLPDSLKYSNLRQARGIPKKLQMMGWQMLPVGSHGEAIIEIPETVVEALAEFEHDEWMRERISSGWIYGVEKDAVKKISPYLVPFEDLSEDVRDLDRDTIRNIPALLETIGMAIYE